MDMRNRSTLIVAIILAAGFTGGVTVSMAITREVINTVVGFFICLVVMTPIITWIAFRAGERRGMEIAGLVQTASRVNYAQVIPNYLPPASAVSRPVVETQAPLQWERIPVGQVDHDDGDIPLILGN